MTKKSLLLVPPIVKEDKERGITAFNYYYVQPIDCTTCPTIEFLIAEQENDRTSSKSGAPARRLPPSKDAPRKDLRPCQSCCLFDLKGFF